MFDYEETPTPLSLNKRLQALMADKDKLLKTVLEEMRSLTVSEGQFAGMPIELYDWEIDFVKGVLENQTSALTVARGNGKTTLVAALGLIAFIGCLSRWRGQVLIVASSLNQGKLSFDHIMCFMAEMLETVELPGGQGVLRPKDLRWKVHNNTHICMIEDRLTQSNLIVLGSDAKRAHGRAPHMVIADEPAKWVDNNGRKMFAALKTSLGKQYASKMVVLGTRPEERDHWFGRMCDDGLDVDYVQNHSCKMGDDDDFSEESINKANPSLKHMPDLAMALEKERMAAMKGGEALTLWRALRLNMGTPETEAVQKLVSVENWDAVCQPDMIKRRSGPVAVGIDLGSGISMSCAALYWPDTGRLEAYGAFPAEPDLFQRGRDDIVGERYVRMFERGELSLFPGRATNNGAFLSKIFEEKLKGEIILGTIADRYKKLDMEQAIQSSGLSFSIVRLQWRAVGRGPDGSADIRAFRRAVMSLEVNCDKSLMMESAIAESVVKPDHNGNEALDKARHNGRNDAVQAAVLAVGLGQRHKHPQKGMMSSSNYLLSELYS